VRIDAVDILTTADDVNLPEYCQARLEYRSTYGSATEFGVHARPRARHRGALLIGPLKFNAVLTGSGAVECTLRSAFAAALCDAAALLQTTAEAVVPGVTEWDQWSRKDAAVRRISHVSVRTTPGVSRRRLDLGPQLVQLSI
jgi:hypothetical protein